MMDESIEAYEAWRRLAYKQGIITTEYAWRACEEWARKDEREKLAKLAENVKSTAIRSGSIIYCLSADEIRAGQLNEP